MKRNKEYLERASYTWSKDSLRLITTASNVAKGTYLYVQEIGRFKTEYPYFTERANLDSYLIVYTLSGQGKLRYKDEEYVVEAGSCFYISCQEHHHYWTEEDQEWEMIWLHFNGSNAYGYYKEFVRNGFRVLYGIDREFMENSLEEIIRLHTKRNLTTEIRSANYIHNIITEILVRNAANDADALFIPDYIKSIAKEIERDFRESFRLDDFARKHNRSRYHIAKEFKRYIGVTLNEYLIISRISHSKELLKYSDLTVWEIADEVGISNVTHFINLFKAREGTTPLNYRKEWRR